MKFISEKVIDEKSVIVGEVESYEEIIEDVKRKQPAFLAFLASESFALLTEDEKSYALYLILVVWESVNKFYPEQEIISAELIEETEEANWEKFLESKGKNFKEKLNVFFENTKQEDLLAFFEDSLIDPGEEEEEENFVDLSSEGRDYIFIVLKTLTDCFEKTID